MRRLLCLPILFVSGCLLNTGCTASLESPAKALGYSNPKVKVWRNCFGAGAEIPTDAQGKVGVKYDAVTGSFEGSGEFSTSASGVVNAEAERSKVALPLAMQTVDNQTKINMASIAAQQAVWDKGFETIGSVGGAFLARPVGSSANGPAGILNAVVPILTQAGIQPQDLVRAMTGATP